MRLKKPLTEQKIAKFLRDGRGTGTGVSYKPWIRKDEVVAT